METKMKGTYQLSKGDKVVISTVPKMLQQPKWRKRLRLLTIDYLTQREIPEIETIPDMPMSKPKSHDIKPGLLVLISVVMIFVLAALSEVLFFNNIIDNDSIALTTGLLSFWLLIMIISLLHFERSRWK